jgi:dipeptidase D
MSKLSGLGPEALWYYFEEILKIPRPSNHEEKVIDFLMDFAGQNRLEAKRDEVGNVVIRKPATSGMENRKHIVLQSHVDMVCEKNEGVDHDFMADPIVPFIENGWIKAQGTTLGADDGIGMATQLALLAAKDIPHGNLECLFTVGEETGLTGAKKLQENLIQGNILINLDSEDEGEIFIGCAGGIDTLAYLDIQKEKLQDKGSFRSYVTRVSGLKGGHSGDDIHKGLANSLVVLNRFLWHLNEKTECKLAHLEGGNLRNAIPREAMAIFSISINDIAILENWFGEYQAVLQNEYKDIEPNLEISLQGADGSPTVYTEKTKHLLLNSLYACPHGVYAWSKDIDGLVETSTNLASVKSHGENGLLVTTSQRSSVTPARADIAAKVASVFRLAGARVEHTDGYPGWKPNPASEILKLSEKLYQRLFNQQPDVKAIHAGLECGLFLDKYPNLDMISIGPTIKGAHSPDERLNIETTHKFWRFLLSILRHAPEIA